MALFKISKGSASALNNQPKTEGYCWFTTDDGKFYIDVNSTTRQILNAGHADTAGYADEAGHASQADQAKKVENNLSIITDNSTIVFDGSEAKSVNINTSSFLKKTGDTMTGYLALTESIGYGTSLPSEANSVEGQIFFLDEEGSSLPNGGTAGQYLVKSSSEDGDATWQDLPFNYDELLALINSKATTTAYTGTLTSSGWSSSAPYSQTITVNGILATDNPFVDLQLSDVSSGAAVIEAWALVGRVSASANNKITAYCYEEKPTVNLPIILKVVR